MNATLMQSGSRGVLPACSKIHPSALAVLLMTFFPASPKADTPVFIMFPIPWESVKLLNASLPLVKVLLRASWTADTPVFIMFPIPWVSVKFLNTSFPLVKVLLRASLAASLSEKKTIGPVT